MKFRILGLADRVEDLVYCLGARKRYSDIDLVVACGDLPYSYVEFVVSVLEVPVLFVRGNHDRPEEESPAGPQTGPLGAIDLHRRTLKLDLESKGMDGDGSPPFLLVAGIEGSVRYKPGPFQYTQLEMWWHVLGLVPRLLLNRLRHGRWLDIFVSHAPPRGTHDRRDPPHHGIDAFRWLIRTFEPACVLHGHVHPHGPTSPVETVRGRTRILNAFGARRIEIELPRRGNLCDHDDEPERSGDSDPARGESP